MKKLNKKQTLKNLLSLCLKLASGLSSLVIVTIVIMAAIDLYKYLVMLFLFGDL